jgi:ribosome-binding factor A
MTSRKVSLRAIAALCDELGPDDGVDPRRIRRGRRKRKKDGKARQVSRQAEVTVELTLGALLDDALQGLRVVRVEPAPDSRRLLVVLGPRDGSAEMTEDEAAAAVRKVEGRLRREVARALHRKRAPSLAFGFVGMREGEPHGD